MKKRIISSIMVLVMMLTFIPTTVFAADTYAPPLKISAEYADGKVTVTVKADAYSGCMGAQVDFNFPDDKLSATKEDIVCSGVLEGATTNVKNTTPTGKAISAAWAGSSARQSDAEETILTVTFSVIDGQTGDCNFEIIKYTFTDGIEGEIETLPAGSIGTASVTIPKAPITSVTAKVDAPQKGVELDTTVDIGGATAYTAAVEWYEGTTATGSPVTGKAKPSQYYYAKITLKAKPGETFDEKFKTGTVNGDYSVTRVSNTELLLTKAYPATADAEVTKVQIAGTPPSLNVPEALGIDQPGTVTAPNTYSVTVFMDGSPVVKPSGVEWSISDLAGVTVDPATGNMTISSDCPGGPIELTATYGGKSDTAKLTVWRADPAAKWLKIVDHKTGGAPQTTIIRPVGTELTDRIEVEYEAKVYDQFSKPVTIKRAYWTLDPMPDKIGAPETVNAPIQKLLVTHNTQAISFDLTAALETGSAIKDTIKINLVEKTLETLTVTQADTTYGTALEAPVFTKPEGTIKTTIHYSTPTSSAYSSATPPTDAGEYVVNVLCETATHIYIGHANFKIEPKSISNMLQPITGTYVYTGAPQRPEAVVKDGEVTLVKDKDYTVSYGTNVHVFEAATVYVEGIGNYTGTFSRNFKIQPKPIDITSAKALDRDYEEGRLDVDCTVTLPVASDVKQGEHYLVFATMDDDTAGSNKTVNVQVKMVKGGLGENYTLKNDTTTATVNINKINPADPTGLKGVKGQKLSAVELPDGWTWYAPSMVMDTAGPQTFLVNYTGDANHNALYMHPITVNVLEKTDVSTFITFPDGEKEYTGSWMKYEAATIKGSGLDTTTAKWNYTYAAGTGTLMEAGFPQGVGTYTVTATYEDSLNFGTATATLTIVPRKVAIPAADTTVYTYDGTAKTYGIADTADYTVTGATQTNANESGYTVTVALRDKTNTAWTDGTTADKTYTFKIMKAASTGEPKYTKITTSGKTLKDAGLTVTGSTLKPNAGTLEWVDDKDNVLPDTTTVAANTTYKWRFTPDDANYKVLTGFIELYHESSSSGGGGVVVGGGGGVTTYPITVKSAKNGDVTASHKSAAKGTTVTLTVAPDKGYVLDTLTVLDGKDTEIKLTEKNGKYTFTMPASKVTVEAAFKTEQSTGKNPFIDVPAGSYYEDAVIWAVDKGITTGTSATAFDPDGICTRAQAVTFLWRAAGSPAAKSAVMPFADVKAGSYYYDAVLWAVENGITKGSSETMFSPDATCSRAQIVTFLWRAGGSPAVSGNSAFTDVAADAYYAAAVTWAEKNGVTGGIGGGLFGSGNNCTRAQIVTFIYRSVK